MALIVDHGLRPESSEEAHSVAAQVRAAVLPRHASTAWVTFAMRRSRAGPHSGPAAGAPCRRSSWACRPGCCRWTGQRGRRRPRRAWRRRERRATRLCCARAGRRGGATCCWPTMPTTRRRRCCCACCTQAACWGWPACRAPLRSTRVRRCAGRHGGGARAGRFSPRPAGNWLPRRQVAVGRCRPAPRRAEWGPVVLARPLLGFRKAELERYCQRTGLRYVVDPTNAQLSHQRNRIRHAMQRWPTVAAAQAASAAEGSGRGPAEGRGGGAAGSAAGRVTHFPTGSSRLGNAPGGSKPDASPLLVDDLLLVQRRCAAAQLQQQALGEELLRRAVLRTSCPTLPCAPAGQPVEQPPPRQQRERTGRGGAWRRRRWDSESSHAWAQQRPWYVDWSERLGQVGGTRLKRVPAGRCRARWRRVHRRRNGMHPSRCAPLRAAGL
jgi:hypothetical protein